MYISTPIGAEIIKVGGAEIGEDIITEEDIGEEIPFVLSPVKWVYSKIKGLILNALPKEVLDLFTKMRNVIACDFGILKPVGFPFTEGAIISSVWCLLMGREIFEILPSGGEVMTLVKWLVGIAILVAVVIPPIISLTL